MAYTTLNTQFDLLPPPPKSIFSTVNNEAGRAWFPDFTQSEDPTGSLRDFIKILFYPSFHKSTFVQLKVLSVLTAIIGISIFLIILRRLYERSFWLFRLVKRSNGTLLVPNAITAFVTIESTFTILLIALCWEVVSWYEYGQSPEYMILWIGLTWLPLILGAWCTTVGIIYARPNALSFVSPQPGKPHSWALRMGITPAIVNFLVFCVPTVQIVTVVVPAALAQRHFSQAFHHYHRWSATFQQGAPLSRELLLEAQQIWFKVLDAAYLISICMAIWEAWVCGLFVCYCLAGGSLITTLRRQLSTLKSFKQNQTYRESNAALRLSDDPFAGVVVSDATNDINDLEKQPTVDAVCPDLLSVQAPPRSLSVSSATSDHTAVVCSSTALEPEGAPDVTSKSAPSPLAGANRIGRDDTDPQTRSMYFTHAELEHEDRPSHTFFPAVRPSAFERPAKARSPAGKQSSQKRYLEKFYLNFIIQFVGLMLCILFFAVFCGKLITTWYSAWEANELGSALQIALLVVCWVTVVLASVIIFAILGRTYEPVLSNLSVGVQGRDSGRWNEEGLAGQRTVSRRLSGASAASKLKKDRRGQGIGLGNLNGRSRTGSLSGPGPTSNHGKADGNRSSRHMDVDAPSPKSQPREFAHPDGTIAPSLTSSESRKQRSAPGSASGTRRRNSAGGVIVEQTVSTIIENPDVEEFYREDPSLGPKQTSLSNQDGGGRHTSWLASLEGVSSMPSGSTIQSEWVSNAHTPATTWNSHVTDLKGMDEEQKHYWESLMPHQPGRVVAAVDGETFVLQRSSNAVLGNTQPHTSVESLQKSCAETTAPPAWSAPSVWHSGDPDATLMREEAEMRLRMASRSIYSSVNRP